MDEDDTVAFIVMALSVGNMLGTIGFLLDDNNVYKAAGIIKEVAKKPNMTASGIARLIIQWNRNAG